MIINVTKELVANVCNYIDSCGLDADEAKIYKRAYAEIESAKYGAHDASDDLAYVIDSMNS